MTDVINTITDFIDNVKILITDTFSFLPSEIFVLFVTAVTIVIALYIYRLVR